MELRLRCTGCSPSQWHHLYPIPPTESIPPSHAKPSLTPSAPYASYCGFLTCLPALFTLASLPAFLYYLLWFPTRLPILLTLASLAAFSTSLPYLSTSLTLRLCSSRASTTLFLLEPYSEVSWTSCGRHYSSLSMRFWPLNLDLYIVQMQVHDFTTVKSGWYVVST